MSKLLTQPLRELLYRDPLSYLERETGSWDNVSRFDIQAPSALYRELGSPQNSVPAILVGGTNGKGSVSATLSAMIFQAGHSVGYSPSPHLSHVTERCLVDGSPVSSDDFGKAIITVIEAASQIGQRPSYFETCVGAAFVEFARRELNWMVIEVGLGGRLDATNTIEKPRASVITSIGFDHMHILGDSLSAIATEKSGIFRRDVPVFVGAVAEEARETLAAQAKRIGAPIEFLGSDFHLLSAEQRSGSPLSGSSAAQEESEVLILRSKDGSFYFHPGEFGLHAPHQRENAALAIRVAQALALPESAIAEGLRTVRWPGRLELFSKNGRTILIDGAHNPDGIEALKNGIGALLAKRTDLTSLTFVLSFLRYKEWQKMLALLQMLSFEKQWITTKSDHKGAASPQEIAALLPSALAFEDVEDALSAAITESPDDSLIVCAGSLYFLGVLRPLLTQAPFCTIARE